MNNDVWVDHFSCGRTTFEGSPFCGRATILTSLEHWTDTIHSQIFYFFSPLTEAHFKLANNFFLFIEHTLCTVGSCASLCICPSVTGPKFRLDNNSDLFVKIALGEGSCIPRRMMVHLQAIASHLSDTPIMVYGTGRWAHFNIKLYFFMFSLPKDWGFSALKESCFSHQIYTL